MYNLFAMMELTQQQIDAGKWILAFVLRAYVLLTGRKQQESAAAEQAAIAKANAEQIAKANAEKVAALQLRQAFLLGVGLTALLCFAIFLFVQASREMRVAA